MRLRAALLGALLACAARADAAELAWVYVESNTGSSSGGHLALRVQGDVYHVQQAGGGVFRIEREAWRTFEHLYAGLGNRTLAVAHLDVAEPDVERAHERLARAYVAQREELRRRDQLALDLAWTEAWRDRSAPPPLAGAGLFAPEGAPDPDALGLRAAAEARFGPGFLAEEAARIDAALHARTASARGLELRERLLLRETLRALDGGRPLAEDAVLPAHGVLAEPLGAEERAGARRHAAALQQAVLELLASHRPDRGHALALAAARHQALARSAERGVLVLLDPYAGAGEPLPPGERASAATWARRAEEIAAPWRHGRGVVLRSGGFDEAQLHLLELGAGIQAEYARGAAGGAVRKLPRTALPAPARLVEFRPDAPAATFAEDARSARAALALHEERLARLYPYGVIRRNCVTEIVRLLNDAYDGEAARALGAELEPGAGFDFVPFAFFESVTRRLRVATIEIVPSHRERELARVLAEDPALARRLGESVTLASSIYTPRWRDGTFLFFTDDVFWSRPALGLANLGWAAGSGVLGLAAAPFDGARRLRAAGSGLWYSVPELFFFNIRKGTYEWVPSGVQ